MISADGLFNIRGRALPKIAVSILMLALLLVSALVFGLGIQQAGSESATITVPDDYPTIQEAINSANEGDTIFVRNGTYSEVVTVNKPVSLVGEDPNSTIINGTVLIESSNVEVARLCIEGGQGISLGNVKGCVVNNTISRGSHSFGVSLSNASDSQISFCEMYSNFYDGICLDHVSNNNTISYNDIHDVNRDGIGIHQSTLNTVEANRIVSVGIGLHIRYSNGNTARKNNVTGCYTGIWMEHSTLNRLHHNSFADNTISTSVPDSANNIWDDGYPSGGNYWSDYDGIDFYHGSYQNETGSDGIGDTPYVIDSSNQDSFPLIHPYGSVCAPTANFTWTPIANLTIRFDASISLPGWNGTGYAPIQTYAWDFGDGNLTTVSYPIIDHKYATSDDYSVTLTVEDSQHLQDSITQTVHVVLIQYPGWDINQDGYTNAKDAVILGSHFGTQTGDPAYLEAADINQDGFINAKDAVILGTHFGE